MSDDDQQTEAGPVTKVARDLTEILTLYAELRDQAEAKANATVDGTGLPGGLSMVALGNVANQEAWANQHQATERHRLGVKGYDRAYTSVEDEDPDEAWSAFQLLEFWSEQWRAEHGAEYGQRPTIASEANFIRHSLNWAWDHEPHWDDFAADMRQARVRLEGVLYAGNRVALSRVECDRCEPAKATEDDDSEHSPRLVHSLGAADDGSEDRWKCPACKQRFDHEGMLRAQASQLRRESAAKYVNQGDAIGTLKAQGRSERTIRKWLTPLTPRDQCEECGEDWAHQEYPACPSMVTGQECGGLLDVIWRGDREAIVDGYCTVGSRKVWVWWPDLWRKHLSTQTRQRTESCA